MCTKTKPINLKDCSRENRKRVSERASTRIVSAFVLVYIYRFTKPYNKRLELKIFFLRFFDRCLADFTFVYFFFIVSLPFPFSGLIFFFLSLSLCSKGIFLRCFIFFFFFFWRSFTGYNNKHVTLIFSVVETWFYRIDLLYFESFLVGKTIKTVWTKQRGFEEEQTLGAFF